MNNEEEESWQSKNNEENDGIPEVSDDTPHMGEASCPFLALYVCLFCLQRSAFSPSMYLII